MRLIDADALWQKIHEHGGCGARPKTWEDGWDKAIDDALDCVEAAPTITPAPRWIPVMERLPEKDDFTLVYRSDRLGCPWDVLYWYGSGWAARPQTAKSITHWMPLPEREWVGKKEEEN